MNPYLVLFLSYLIGSLPTGLTICKLIKGKDFDIRNFGSHNVGFTNVYRVLGAKVGLIVILLDILKGFVPGILGLYFSTYTVAGFCVIAAILGHARSVVMFILERKFSGGKSVATALGGMLALQPLVAVIAFFIWLVVLLVTDYMSVASLSGAWAAVALMVIFHKSPFWIGLCGLVAIFITYTHLLNIARLIEGCENRFRKRPAKTDEGPLTGFLICPKDMKQMCYSKLVRFMYDICALLHLPERWPTIIAMHLPAMKFAEITNLKSVSGKPRRMVLLGMTIFASDITAKKKIWRDGKEVEVYVREKLIRRRLREAAELAERMGCKTLYLGGVTSSVSMGGGELQDWCDKKGLKVKIGNGGLLTIVATLVALEQVCPDFRNKRIAIVGGSGYIGGGCVIWLKRQKLDFPLIVIGRTAEKLAEFQGELKIQTGTSIEMLKDTDIIISLTSSGPIFTKENIGLLKKGVVILDVAVPPDVSDELLNCPDIKVVRCGLVSLPAIDGKKPDCPYDLGFGYLPDGEQLFPACLAEGLVITDTDRYDMISCSARARPEQIDWFWNVYSELGFRIYNSQVCERQVFGAI